MFEVRPCAGGRFGRRRARSVAVLAIVVLSCGALGGCTTQTLPFPTLNRVPERPQEGELMSSREQSTAIQELRTEAGENDAEEGVTPGATN